MARQGFIPGHTHHLNSRVYVKLTNGGYVQLQAFYYAQKQQPHAPDIPAETAIRAHYAGNDEWTFLLWELLLIFGPVVGRIGHEGPFVGCLVRFEAEPGT